MKKILLSLIMCLWAVPVLASDSEIDFLQNLSKDVIENGIEGTHSHSEREAFMRQRFTANLDLKSIGQFVLGAYWKKASDTEKQEFLSVFTELLTKTWTDRFGLYNGQTVKLISSRPAQQKNQFYVESEIQDKTPIALVWRVRSKNDTFLIIDISVEGVSMAMSYRSEYTTFLQQHQGRMADLISELKTKVKNFKYSTKK